MSKILLVTYTPRDDSNTAKLVDTFLEYLDDVHIINHVDLVQNPPPFLLEDNLRAHLKRNFMGQQLTVEEDVLVAGADRLMNAVLDADRIVLAFPMYNFSLPAAVKAWFDAIIQNQRTFQLTEDGQYLGLCGNKKALILMTAGSDFSQENMQPLNHALPLAQTCLGFLGVASDAITAYGLNQYPDKVQDIVKKSQQEVQAFLASNSEW